MKQKLTQANSYYGFVSEWDKKQDSVTVILCWNRALGFTLCTLAEVFNQLGSAYCSQVIQVHCKHNFFFSWHRLQRSAFTPLCRHGAVAQTRSMILVLFLPWPWAAFPQTLHMQLGKQGLWQKAFGNLQLIPFSWLRCNRLFLQWVLSTTRPAGYVCL